MNLIPEMQLADTAEKDRIKNLLEMRVKSIEERKQMASENDIVKITFIGKGNLINQQTNENENLNSSRRVFLVIRKYFVQVMFTNGLHHRN